MCRKEAKISSMRKSFYFSNFYYVLEWVMWLLYLNLLWLLFTLLGFGVFGLFPATVSMFAVIRQLLQQKDLAIFKTFFQTYKQEFFKANGVGLVLFIITYLLYMDLLFLDHIPSSLFAFFQIGLLIATIIFIIVLLYIFPVYVHFDLTFLQTFKHALIIGIFSPLANLLTIIGFIVLFFIYRWLPGLIPTFGISLIALLLMFSGLFAFNRIQEKQAKLSEQEKQSDEQS